MRRKDRELQSKEELTNILDNNKVLRLAMVNDGKPYVVPLNFGYEWQDKNLIIYCHCAKTGLKLDILKQNNQVCLEMDSKHVLLESDLACNYGFAYESMIGFGEAEIVSDVAEKEKGLQLLMKHQAGMEKASFTAEMLNMVEVIKIVATDYTGKRCLAPNEK